MTTLTDRQTVRQNHKLFMIEKQWIVYLDANTMTTLLHILYTESQDITPTLVSHIYEPWGGKEWRSG